MAYMSMKSICQWVYGVYMTFADISLRLAWWQDNTDIFYLVSFQFFFSFEFLYPFKCHTSTKGNNFFLFILNI